MADMINVVISSTVSSFGAERRFPIDSTIHSLKVQIQGEKYNLMKTLMYVVYVIKGNR